MAPVQKNTRSLHWAIVGPGQIAHQFIEDMRYVSGYDCDVTAVMSRSLREAEEFAGQYHIPAYFDNLEKMLTHHSPDVVYIATPHADHFDQAAACLRRQIPVLCEKPFALNEEQGKQLIRLSREQNTFLMEGMWIRFLPDIKQVITLLEENSIGSLNSVVADMSYQAPRDKNNRFYDPSLGGGSLLDLGIYPVYLAMLTLGLPDRIKAGALLSEEGIDKSCAMILEYNSGAYAVLESSIIKETGKSATLFGSKGKIIIEPPWNEKPKGISVVYNDYVRDYPCSWDGRGFQYEMEEVADCLSNGKIESPLHSHQQSLTLLHIMDEIRRQTGITYPADRFF